MLYYRRCLLLSDQVKLAPPVLELGVLVSHHVGAGKQALTKKFLTAEPSLQSLGTTFDKLYSLACFCFFV